MEEIMIKIRKASRFIEGVVLTGGEPMLYPNKVKILADAIHDLGLKVKLDTNGLENLQGTNNLGEILIEEIAPDYLAMDIKSDYEGYYDLGPVSGTISFLQDNIDYLKKSNIDYEFRTTMVFPFVSKEKFPAIAKMVSGAKKYVLQKARLDHVMMGDFVGMEALDDLEHWRKLFKPYVDKVEIR